MSAQTPEEQVDSYGRVLTADDRERLAAIREDILRHIRGPLRDPEAIADALDESFVRDELRPPRRVEAMHDHWGGVQFDCLELLADTYSMTVCSTFPPDLALAKAALAHLAAAVEALIGIQTKLDAEASETEGASDVH